MEDQDKDTKSSLMSNIFYNGFRFSTDIDMSVLLSLQFNSLREILIGFFNSAHCGHDKSLTVEYLFALGE